MSSSLCDACGLPPKPNQRLLICTRCNSAKYHDLSCQKKHYPQHKKLCRQIAAKKANAAAVIEPLVECQSVTKKGRGLVAVSTLSIGCHPLSRIKKDCSNDVEIRKDGLCTPMVPPTLIESMRTTRCTYCFQLIGNGTSSPTNLLHVHCSMKCRNLDKFWKNEQIASMKLISSGATSSMPSPTVLTCCRILISSVTNPTVMTKYNELCYDDGCDINTEQVDLHLNIVKQCHHLLLAMGNTSAAKLAHDFIEPNPILAFQFISRLTMNGFTICNAEQKALGVGVYRSASMINHSCRPNAVQSFWLSGSSSDDDHYPPMLQITVCRDAKVGEEITISYCDASAPRHVRQKGLKMNYNFVCDCALCQDTERDDVSVGLICVAPGGCNGRVRSSSSDLTSIDSPLDKNQQYRCETCGHCNFEDSLKAISKLMTRIETIETKLKDGSVLDSIKYDESTTGRNIKQLFDLMTKYCNPQTSWYVAWNSDVFVHWCANALNHVREEGEQLKICQQALSVLEKSRNATKFCYDYDGSLVWFIKRGMEAKLRLFVNPVDFEALNLMRVVRKNLLHYYPSTDEIVSSLDESIRAYSYS